MNTQQILVQMEENIKKLRTKEGYLNAGYPNYNTLFGRDSLIVAWQLLDYDPAIAKNTLKILAKYQSVEHNNKKDSEPGKILHEYRLSNEARKELPEWEWPYYGTIDATSLFVIVFGEYIKKTGNTGFAKKLWDNIEKAMLWHFENAKNNEYGFITYNPKNPHGLVHQGWKDAIDDHLKISPPVAIAEEQGYAYKAYKTFAELAHTLGDTENNLVKKALYHAEELKINFKKMFWIEDEKCFAIGLDGNNNIRKSIASNMGHLLACDDFLKPEDAEAVKNRLFKKDMLTIGGIRTLSEDDPDFNPYSYHQGSIWPHDNWFIFIGFMANGYYKEAERIKLSMIKVYNTLGHIPELFAVDKGNIYSIPKASEMQDNDNKTSEQKRGFNANPLQAWATGALLDMLEMK